MFTLKGKTAVITGGGSGIGRAIALLFAQQGALVHLVDRDQNAVEETIEVISAYGPAQGHGADVSNQQQVVTVFNTIGPVDILVNNAGIAHIGNAETTSEADFDRICAVNIKGVYNCLFAVIPGMKARNGGVILNTSSIAAHVGLTERFAYSASKGAVHAMTLSVARDFLQFHIRCNSISPARIHTPFVDGFIRQNYPGQEQEMFEKLSQTQPIGRMGEPSEVASLALYLCSEEAGFITGMDYPIDGGFITLNT